MTKVLIEVSESVGPSGLVYQLQIAVEPGRVVTCDFLVCDKV